MRFNVVSLVVIMTMFLSGLGSPEKAPAADDFIPEGLYARYHAESLRLSGSSITAWSNVAKAGSDQEAARRDLNRIVGQPLGWRVITSEGERTVMRLDGRSGIWQTVGDWGTLDTSRTIVAVTRLSQEAEGFLFDGSTNTGMTRAQVRAGKWQVGFQPPPIGNAANGDMATHPALSGAWQVHVFTFEKATEKTKGLITIGHSVRDRDGWRTVSVDSNVERPLGGLIMGTNAATQKGLATDVAEMLVFNNAVPHAEQQRLTDSLWSKWGDAQDAPADRQLKAAQLPDDPRLFRTVLRKPGDDGSKAYRIPGLATTPKGTLLAVFDIRYDGGADLPGNIDVGLMRSTDHGTTWSPMQTILDFDKSVPGSRGNGVGDPSILVDRETGTVFVAALWSKGNRSWHGSGPGLTPEETGQFVLTKSTDDGITWSAPINITSQVKTPSWRLCFQGPGAGITLRDGTLVFPAQFREGATSAAKPPADKRLPEGAPHSCFIYSRDHGSTWKTAPAAIPGFPPTSESQIAELEDGSLLLTMRDESKSGKRAWARWQWNPDRATNKDNNSPQATVEGTWSEPWSVLPDPTCMASLIRHPDGDLLFSNPNSPSRRVAMTIRTSRDAGKTWSDGRLLDPRGSMYSSMSILKDGRIGIVYEVAGTLTFTRFPLDWVKTGP